MNEESNLTESLIQNSEDDKDVISPVLPPIEGEDLGAGSNVNDSEEAWTRGEKQPSRFRDAPFALLFFAQIIAVMVVAFVYGVPEMEDFSSEDDAGSEVDFTGLMYASLIAGGSSLVLSALSLSVMIKFASSLVKISLIFSAVTSLFIATMALLVGNILGSILGFVSFLLVVCYTCCVWKRIPWAAANLKTGLTAIKINYGVTLVAYLLVVVSFAWSVLWVVATVGVLGKTSDCNDGTCQESSLGSFYLILMLLAFFWTAQVIQNTTHVTVAGTVGEWWFDPSQASSFCSEAVSGSFIRATTYSFGSICLGSLLVAILQALRQIVQQARQDEREGNILLLILQCVLDCLESLLEYFNKWAYVYVGLYGYSYTEAGKNVMNLFKQRGWTTIITDDLVSNTLSLVCLVLAGLSGCIGLIINAAQSSWFVYFGDNAANAAFILSFVIGFTLASTLINVVDSAVNTVIVCFAEAPADFQANHPELSENMRQAWISVHADISI